MSHLSVRGLIDLSKWNLLYGKKFEFCERCSHEKQHKGVIFGDFTLLCLSKQILEDRDLGVQLEVELECETPISLKLEDAILDPIQVLEVQQYGNMPNLDIKPSIKVSFEDMVANAFSAKDSTNMMTTLSLMIEFKGGLDLLKFERYLIVYPLGFSGEDDQ